MVHYFTIYTKTSLLIFRTVFLILTSFKSRIHRVLNLVERLKESFSIIIMEEEFGMQLNSQYDN